MENRTPDQARRFRERNHLALVAAAPRSQVLTAAVLPLNKDDDGGERSYCVVDGRVT